MFNRTQLSDDYADHIQQSGQTDSQLLLNLFQANKKLNPVGYRERSIDEIRAQCRAQDAQRWEYKPK